MKFEMVIKWKNGIESKHVGSWQSMIDKLVDIDMTAMEDSISSLTIEPFAENR